jgi:hypothetical protein
MLSGSNDDAHHARPQVHEQSNRQRDVALRSRRLLSELGSAAGVDASALAALGPDVLADGSRKAVATLAHWSTLPSQEWQAALQQLSALLSTGAALSGPT